MSVNKVKVELVNFKKTGEHMQFVYSVAHNNGETTVEQLLTLTSVDELFAPTWTANIAFNEFPTLKTPGDAAMKLADWMARLALAIKTGEYNNVCKSEFKDITNTEGE